MEPKDDLTLNDKHLIRTYLLKLVTIPALGVAVLPFLISYFVKDVAQLKAQSETQLETYSQFKEITKIAYDQLTKITGDLYKETNQFYKKSTADQIQAEEALKKTEELYKSGEEKLKQVMEDIETTRNDAEKELGITRELNINAKDLHEQTTEIQKKTSDALTNINQLRVEAEQTKGSSDLLKADLDPKNLVDDLTNALTENPTFAQLIIRGVSTKIDLPIGTILPSLTPPENFLEGDKAREWTSADGKQISTDSLYAKITGQIQVPDLRGMFLRGLNAFKKGVVRKDDKRDPDGDRTPGDYQQDAIQQHGHDTKATMGGWLKLGQGYTQNMGGLADHATVNAVKDANAAVETRPKNVAVYYYIKIN